MPFVVEVQQNDVLEDFVKCKDLEKLREELHRLVNETNLDWKRTVILIDRQTEAEASRDAFWENLTSEMQSRSV